MKHCRDRIIRTVRLELNYNTVTIFALIESPSDKHQRHARRYSTNVSRTHTAIRQKSAAYTPLFNKCQRHTHRYLTNVSGIYTAIRQNPTAYSPLFDKCQRYTPRYSTRSTCTAICVHRTRACVHIFATRIPNKFAVELWQLSLSLHYVRFAVDLPCCLRFNFACLLVCLPPKRNDRTRRGPMQRGATLPLPFPWPSTKSCSNTCGQPHCATCG